MSLALALVYESQIKPHTIVYISSQVKPGKVEEGTADEDSFIGMSQVSHNQSQLLRGQNITLLMIMNLTTWSYLHSLKMPRGDSFYSKAKPKGNSLGLLDNPKQKDWLSDDILQLLHKHKPQVQYKAGECVPHENAFLAFSSVFPATKHGKGGREWDNAYQLEQAVTKLGDWYGCALKFDGTTIHCACSLTAKQKKKQAQTIQEDRSNLFLPHGDDSSKRKRESQSSICCPWFLKYSRISNRGGQGKADTPVRVTQVNFEHNHTLSKEMIIRAKRQCHQYTVPLPSCIEIMKLSKHGPIPIQILRGYMQDLYPNTQVITAQMVGNLRIPGVELRRAFEPASMEVAPENIYNDPAMAKIFEEAIIEIFMGDDPNEFELVRIMELVKKSQPNGYDYRVYRGVDGRPRGVIQMTPFQKKSDIRYGDVLSMDAQLKYRNTLGWVYWSMTGTNNFNTIANSCDSLTIAETDHFQAFAIRAKAEMSGRPLSSQKIIAVDGKTDMNYIRQQIPGKFDNNFNNYGSSILYSPIHLVSELPPAPHCLIIRDHYHLKNHIFPKAVGDALWDSIKEHPLAALQ